MWGHAFCSQTLASTRLSLVTMQQYSPDAMPFVNLTAACSLCSPIHQLKCSHPACGYKQEDILGLLAQVQQARCMPPGKQPARLQKIYIRTLLTLVLG